MLCHERSPVKLDEAHLFNNGFWEYPCFDDVERVFDNCGGDLFEPMFEAYRGRLISGTSKPQGYTRVRNFTDPYNNSETSKVRHY